MYFLALYHYPLPANVSNLTIFVANLFDNDTIINRITYVIKQRAFLLTNSMIFRYIAR